MRVQGGLQTVWQGTIERPTGLAWLEAAGCLLVCDPQQGRLARFDPARGEMAFLELGTSPSFCAATSEGELLLGDGLDLVRIDREGESEVEIRIDMPDTLSTGLATVDPRGRLWFAAPDRSAVEEAPAGQGGEGRVYRYHDGRMIPTLFDRTRPGGLAVSRDARTLFHANGAARTIEAYPVNSASALSQGQVWARLPSDAGEPRGLALDAQGHLWVALSGGDVVRIAPGGQIVERLDVPGMAPLDVAFGGEDLRTLFVSAPGAILSRDLAVPGLPQAALRLSAGALGLIEEDDH